MQESGEKETRFPITYFDGINSTVQATLAKRTELSHSENARSPKLGVLEKREGQTVYGANIYEGNFVSTKNGGLIYFPSENSSQAGILRISSSSEPTSTLEINVFDQIYINEPFFVLSSFTIKEDVKTFQTFLIENITITEPSFGRSLDFNTIIVSNSEDLFNIYYLSTTDKWTKITDSDGNNIIGGTFDSANVEQKLILVNRTDKNRYIKEDGTTIKTSANTGNLYGSPNASKVCYYKNRIHLADFMMNGLRYPTSIIRSSYPLGIIALVDGDHQAGAVTLNVTDTKYFQTYSSMANYEIRRGSTLITTIQVTAINETSLTVSSISADLKSADEIWVGNSYESEKEFRWINNPTSSGRDVKQYDTFQLSGGTEDPITLFETIGNVLMVGNHFSLATWDDYNLTSMNLNIGCSSTNGSTKLLGTLYFIHYSGVYASTGATPTLLSRKVERYIRGATKEGLENAAAGYKGLSVFFTIGDVILYNDDGSLDKTLSDVCLEYSVADQNWYVHTNVPISEFVSFLSTDGKEHLLGARTDGIKKVVDFLSGNTDDGSEIFFRVDTQDLQLLKEMEIFSNPLAIVTETQRGSQMKCYISTDRSKFYELNGTIKKGVTILKINTDDPDKTQPVLARKIKISYRDSSKQRCRLSQIAIIYLPTTISEPTE